MGYNNTPPKLHKRLLTLALAGAMTLLAACDNNSSNSGPTDNAVETAKPPVGLGQVETAPVQNESTVLPFVDYAYTNQRGDARYATQETNAGVRVLAGFLKVWEPSSLLVDADVSAEARDGFPAVVKSSWTGIPGDATDGRVLDTVVHDENIDFSMRTTTSRTDEQELAAYLDDRRGKGYSVTDGLGPLTEAWRTAARQFTTITDIPADADTVKYDDEGNNTGVSGDANPEFGKAITFVQNMGTNASTEPAKRFYKYARPWRWSDQVVIAPSLVPATSSTPNNDGGFPSGHTAESVRNAIAIAYLVPERFQEMVARGVELGENRIIAGMHSPMDVIGGRILGQASALGNIYAQDEATRQAAYDQAHQTLMSAVNAQEPADFLNFAHSASTTDDRFADHQANKEKYRARLTFGFQQTGDTTREAVVPKGAEVLLETRLPYLDAEQRRVVLKTTALPSGYPVLDDAEGFGRLNLFDAADGYGAFNGDVIVNMDGNLGGFNAQDSWRNDISGAGKLTKKGSGTLILAGNNSYTGGTILEEGTLQADADNAFGTGDVYVEAGRLAGHADKTVNLAGRYTQLAEATLALSLGQDGAGRINSTSTVDIVGGGLEISFRDGYQPQAGDVLEVIKSASFSGKFSNITVDGFQATPEYSATGLKLKLE
ncbi:autotransporter-associated beta strand protein [Gibbsiella quercinecans]|uniref:Phosphatidic acid phosphatase type 2/haloperoxidase domain-containing protein n=1 Tax=Gibbsiella quercinecans TaxID=929813 RepID=A0A250B635_9GAMM|nr:phosphatase PAP2 family protein [Gibbsiella quercinecans]ATA21708.1 hypothetical protein AWC35_21515 [Gibbsiella quercinecans]RLM02367.1 hypothetical protein BIY31_23825 [Gibbsiella quercinecans]RLM04222.1 hypothetical protein BIY30_20915 [Gibbsiella quercinecans]TCT88969.1 autotransporter-associated beta strand protein [Gibbsiella quercinecans]